MKTLFLTPCISMASPQYEWAYVFDRPGVGGAVLQTAFVNNGLTHSSFPSKSSKQLHAYQISALPFLLSLWFVVS